MTSYNHYLEGINNLAEKYQTTVSSEHQFIHEILEGELPLFKLILAEPHKKGVSEVIISFHLELGIVNSIEWFDRLREFYDNLYLTGCYIKDSQGTTYVGEDAEIYKLYEQEQHVISNWIRQNQDEMADTDFGLKVNPKESRGYTDMDSALKAFEALKKGKNDICH